MDSVKQMMIRQAKEYLSVVNCFVRHHSPLAPPAHQAGHLFRLVGMLYDSAACSVSLCTRHRCAALNSVDGGAEVAGFYSSYDQRVDADVGVPSTGPSPPVLTDPDVRRQRRCR